MANPYFRPKRSEIPPQITPQKILSPPTRRPEPARLGLGPTHLFGQVGSEEGHVNDVGKSVQQVDPSQVPHLLDPVNKAPLQGGSLLLRWGAGGDSCSSDPMGESPFSSGRLRTKAYTRPARTSSAKPR